MANNVSTVNITRVLRTIVLQPGLSRVEIAARLGLNKSTISKIVGFLEELGVVEPAAVGSAGPTGGRRPIHLRIRADWGCIMGVEVQTEGLAVIGINLTGEIFFSHEEPHDLRQQPLVDSLVSIIERFRPDFENRGLPLIGVGVGLPGFVDPVAGSLNASRPLEQYEPIAVVDETRARLDLSIPILVDNDANCGCWGELAANHANRPQNFMFVLGEIRKHTIDMDHNRFMALGMGLVFDGRVHHGRDFSTGEFRSILFRPGTVNQFSMTDEEARRFLRDPEIDRAMADELGRHVGFLVNFLNLERVVIGGQMEAIVDQLSPAIREAIDVNWAYPGTVSCEITVSRHGEFAVAYGAAAMFLEHLIQVPAPGEPVGSQPRVGVALLPALRELQQR